MNRSGAAVAALVNWLKLTPSDVLVVVDDADLPLGQIRLRSSGGSGGHNGLRSIIEALGGSEEFARLASGSVAPTEGPWQTRMAAAGRTPPGSSGGRYYRPCVRPVHGG